MKTPLYPSHWHDPSIHPSSPRSSCQRSVQWLCQWCLPVDEAEHCWACAGAWNLGFCNVGNVGRRFFFRYQSRKEKPGKVLKLDDFLRILPLGNHVFSPFWENMLYMLELFPRILSKSKKKGWDDGERQMGCVVVFFCLGGFKYWCLIYPPPSNSLHRSGLLHFQ